MPADLAEPAGCSLDKQWGAQRIFKASYSWGKSAMAAYDARDCLQFPPRGCQVLLSFGANELQRRLIISNAARWRIAERLGWEPG